MLEKQAGNLNVEKLGIRLHSEAYSNQNHKWLGQAIRFQAEQLQLIAPKQYGSCNNQLAALQCLNKRLVYDLIQFTQTPLELCSNDAKSCYDRIVLVIATLCLCRLLGAPQNAVQSMLSTHYGMRSQSSLFAWIVYYQLLYC